MFYFHFLVVLEKISIFVRAQYKMDLTSSAILQLGFCTYWTCVTLNILFIPKAWGRFGLENVVLEM